MVCEESAQKERSNLSTCFAICNGECIIVTIIGQPL